MDNLEGLLLGGSATRYFVDPLLMTPIRDTEPGVAYYYQPSPLEKEIRRIFDRATDKLSKQTA